MGFFIPPQEGIHTRWSYMKISTKDSTAQTIYQEFHGFAKSYTLSKTLVKVRSLTVTVLHRVFSGLWDHDIFVFCHVSCPCQTYGPRGQEHSAVWSCSLMGDGHPGGSETCSLCFPLSFPDSFLNPSQCKAPCTIHRQTMVTEVQSPPLNDV